MGLQGSDNCGGCCSGDTCSPSAGGRLAATQDAEQSPDGNGFQSPCAFSGLDPAGLKGCSLLAKQLYKGHLALKGVQIKRFVNKSQNSLRGTRIVPKG